MSANMWLATCAWILLILGFARRANRKQHVRLMLAGIGLDLLLVIYLQITREAIQTAFAFRLSFLQQAHIAASSVALLLYFPVLFFGVSLLLGKGGRSTRVWHGRLAKLALLFRTLGFFLMFSMWHTLS